MRETFPEGPIRNAPCIIECFCGLPRQEPRGECVSENEIERRMSRPLAEVDPEVAEAIERETERQHAGLELIASENFVSQAVLDAMGSVFTNKYAEGYPGRRYYGGCQWADRVESLAIERAKQLFGAEHANVQPHAGSQANMAAYAALLKPGDVVCGMEFPAANAAHQSEHGGETYYFCSASCKSHFDGDPEKYAGA